MGGGWGWIGRNAKVPAKVLYAQRQRSLSPMVFISNGRPHSTSPTIDRIPPNYFEPFIECDLGPFTAMPPMCVKESRIFGGSHGPMILRQMVHEDRARAHGMPVTGYEQDSSRMERLKAFGNVAGLCESGVQFKGA